MLTTNFFAGFEKQAVSMNWIVNKVSGGISSRVGAKPFVGAASKTLQNMTTGNTPGLRSGMLGGVREIKNVVPKGMNPVQKFLTKRKVQALDLK
jgi:hypothetical protein